LLTNDNIFICLKIFTKYLKENKWTILFILFLCFKNFPQKMNMMINNKLYVTDKKNFREAINIQVKNEWFQQNTQCLIFQKMCLVYIMKFCFVKLVGQKM
jgi:hypothetical protein